ncbi:hypothetical protein BGP_6500 [Beggiatoa sp. PS]|nr:hypothetical protein BGP_6500 [Beggiatoa sp. PS]
MRDGAYHPRNYSPTCGEFFCSLAQDCSQRAAPTQDIPVRTAGPAPPKSKPISLNALKSVLDFISGRTLKHNIATLTMESN